MAGQTPVSAQPHYPTLIWSVPQKWLRQTGREHLGQHVLKKKDEQEPDEREQRQAR
jgi:hypothetical protein